MGKKAQVQSVLSDSVTSRFTQNELRTGPEAVHNVLGAGLVFLGPCYSVPRQAQQEQQPSGHEEL